MTGGSTWGNTAAVSGPFYHTSQTCRVAHDGNYYPNQIMFDASRQVNTTTEVVPVNITKVPYIFLSLQ